MIDSTFSLAISTPSNPGVYALLPSALLKAKWFLERIMTVTVISKTPLVVPPSVRGQAGLKRGQQIEFKVVGGVIIRPKAPAADDEYPPEQPGGDRARRRRAEARGTRASTQTQEVSGKPRRRPRRTDGPGGSFQIRFYRLPIRPRVRQIVGRDPVHHSLPRLHPRSALEAVGEPRLARITRAIFSSRYSIHDLSRCTGEGSENLARFNMPLELGMAMARRYNGTADDHEWLILIPKGAYLHFVSDLAAFNPATHDGTVKGVVFAVMPWLATREGGIPPVTPAQEGVRLDDLGRAKCVTVDEDNATTVYGNSSRKPTKGRIKQASSPFKASNRARPLDLPARSNSCRIS